jgi:hypothetical protein
MASVLFSASYAKAEITNGRCELVLMNLDVKFDS